MILGLFSNTKEGIRKWFEEKQKRLFELKFGMGPIYVEKDDDFELYWLQSVTYRRDPDGTRFFLRCRPTPDKKARGIAPLKLLNVQMITKERGRYVYRKPKDDEWTDKDRLLPSDKTSGGIGYPRGEGSLRGDRQARGVAEARDSTGGRGVDGHGEPHDDQTPNG